ncbi:putative quinol monooxygenase [Streptantibioticus ferralitis]|uniref:Antibiotic biosynthesis monooxygenase n=1 Tax=Streptantibioticus ferralitis TaxID=236510 RepID=A0ABT5YT83_9ACTN|nr:antibiotic biosynthesis monooxygenase [Streptantibioticus ferralitis]MDF2254816.1 antibiotic biosynthesis monooxygenase [Streptantibioticus ferralitis]
MSTPTIGRFVTMRAQPGRGGELADILSRVAAALAAAPGCQMYVICEDKNDPDTVRVVEMWADQDSVTAALAAVTPEAEFTVEDVLNMLSGSPEVVEFTPLSGPGLPS